MDTQEPGDNRQLRELFEEDRSDSVTFRGVEAFVASQARRWIAQTIAAAGEVRTANDYYYAARLLQHGEQLEHWAQARELALRAAGMGHADARYMAAAALDRWLLRQGKPQKYGTNSVWGKDGWWVGDYDPATTDEERAEWNVPPLAELIDRARGLDRGRTVGEIAGDPIVAVEFGGRKMALYSHPPEEPSSKPPAYIRSPPGDASPRWMPDGSEGSYRFGPMWVSRWMDKDAPLVSWRYCTWEVVGESLSKREMDRLVKAIGEAPIRLNGDGRVWSRVVRRIPSGGCWLVGGSVGWEALERVVGSLYP